MDEKKKSPVGVVEDTVPSRPAGNVSKQKGLLVPWVIAMPQTERAIASELQWIKSWRWGPELPDLPSFQEKLEICITSQVKWNYLRSLWWLTNETLSSLTAQQKAWALPHGILGASFYSASVILIELWGSKRKWDSFKVWLHWETEAHWVRSQIWLLKTFPEVLSGHLGGASLHFLIDKIHSFIHSHCVWGLDRYFTPKQKIWWDAI